MSSEGAAGPESAEGSDGADGADGVDVLITRFNKVCWRLVCDPVRTSSSARWGGGGAPA